MVIFLTKKNKMSMSHDGILLTNSGQHYNIDGGFRGGCRVPLFTTMSIDTIFIATSI